MVKKEKYPVRNQHIRKLWRSGVYSLSEIIEQLERDGFGKITRARVQQIVRGTDSPRNKK
jgi:hypothetical protein